MRLNQRQIQIISNNISDELQKENDSIFEEIQKDPTIKTEAKDYYEKIKKILPEHIYDGIFRYGSLEQDIFNCIVKNQYKPKYNISYNKIENDINLKIIDFNGTAEMLQDELINKYKTNAEQTT